MGWNPMRRSSITFAAGGLCYKRGMEFPRTLVIVENSFRAEELRRALARPDSEAKSLEWANPHFRVISLGTGCMGWRADYITLANELYQQLTDPEHPQYHGAMHDWWLENVLTKLARGGAVLRL